MSEVVYQPFWLGNGAACTHRDILNVQDAQGKAARVATGDRRLAPGDSRYQATAAEQLARLCRISAADCQRSSGSLASALLMALASSGGTSGRSVLEHPAAGVHRDD